MTHVLRACAIALAGFLSAWLLLAHASAQMYDYASTYYNYYPTNSTSYPSSYYSYPYSYNSATTYPYNYNYNYNSYSYPYGSSSYNYNNSYPYNTSNWSTSCGALRFSCTRGSVARCVNSNWACYRIDDTSYLYGSNNYHRNDYYRYTGSVTRRYNDNPCWKPAPDCGSWTLRCTAEGWRCDRPAGSNVYPYDSYNTYNSYSYPYNYNTNYNYSYGYDSCSPQTACTGPNSYCPSGTVCSMYRQGYACVPTNCPYSGW